MKITNIVSFLPAVAIAALPFLAVAHSTVSPSQTSPSKYETFSVSVPTEREVPTIGIRLVVPETLSRVTPVVKPGWKITTKKDASGNVTEVQWTGGSIPADQKDLFQFTARTTSTPAVLAWKIYQSYRGGEIVAWDQDPAGGHDKVEHPYSVTEVSEPVATTEKKDQLPLMVSFGALLISLGAMAIAMRK